MLTYVANTIFNTSIPVPWYGAISKILKIGRYQRTPQIASPIHIDTQKSHNGGARQDQVTVPSIWRHRTIPKVDIIIIYQQDKGISDCKEDSVGGKRLELCQGSPWEDCGQGGRYIHPHREEEPRSTPPP